MLGKNNNVFWAIISYNRQNYTGSLKRDGLTMTIYKSKSGQTALKVNNEITSIFCLCYRLEGHEWHHVGDTEPFDPYTKDDVLEGIPVDMVEQLDKQEFDLSKSLSEINED